jgi:hypothetical protein
VKILPRFRVGLTPAAYDQLVAHDGDREFVQRETRNREPDLKPAIPCAQDVARRKAVARA